jgi:hypothetical protein
MIILKCVFIQGTYPLIIFVVIHSYCFCVTDNTIWMLKVFVLFQSYYLAGSKLEIVCEGKFQ